GGPADLGEVPRHRPDDDDRQRQEGPQDPGGGDGRPGVRWLPRGGGVAAAPADDAAAILPGLQATGGEGGGGGPAASGGGGVAGDRGCAVALQRATATGVPGVTRSGGGERLYSTRSLRSGVELVAAGGHLLPGFVHGDAEGL